MLSKDLIISVNRIIEEESIQYMGIAEITIDIGTSHEIVNAAFQEEKFEEGMSKDIGLCLYSDEYLVYENIDKFNKKYKGNIHPESIIPEYEYSGKNGSLKESAYCAVNGIIKSASELNDNYYVDIKCGEATLSVVLTKIDSVRIVLGGVLSAVCWTEIYIEDKNAEI